MEWHASEMDFQEVEDLANDISAFASRYARKTGDYGMATKLGIATMWIDWANEKLAEERPHRASKSVQLNFFG